MSREATQKLLGMIEDGVLDRDTVMSEADVADMSRANEFFDDDDEEGLKMFDVYEWTVRLVHFRNAFAKTKTVEAANYEDAAKLAFAELAGDGYEAADFGVTDVRRGRLVAFEVSSNPALDALRAVVGGEKESDDDA